jgi:hypothetical protein
MAPDPVIACGARAVTGGVFGTVPRQRREIQIGVECGVWSLGECACAKSAPGRRPMVPCRRATRRK